jgi:hypothetical protein
MKRSTYFILTAAVTLFFTQTIWAQNTLTYSTADYDDETNTVYGYSFTNPDYAAGLYYTQTYVGASISDANGTLIDSESKMAYNTRAEVYLEGPGTGNPPYKVSSGHYVFMSYYVYNYSVFQDARSFVSETAKSQFQYTSMVFSNVNLSAPKSGRVTIRAYRKRPSSDFPDNKVRVTIGGTLGGGRTFSTPGRVTLTCN